MYTYYTIHIAAELCHFPSPHFFLVFISRHCLMFHPKSRNLQRFGDCRLLRFGPVHDACTVEDVLELLQGLKVTLELCVFLLRWDYRSYDMAQNTGCKMR